MEVGLSRYRVAVAKANMALRRKHVYYVGQRIDEIERSRSRGLARELFARSLLRGVRGHERLVALLRAGRGGLYGGLTLTAALDLGVSRQERVHGGDEQEGEERREDEAPDDGDAQGAARLRARAEPDRD